MIAVTLGREKRERQLNSNRLTLWLSTLAIYIVFCVWYTNLDGPLTEAEIDAFVTQLRDNGMPEEGIARVRLFMEEDTGRQFIMINAIDLNDAPPELPATGPGASATELMDHYMEHMYPAQFARASHPIFAGRAVFDAMDLAGIEGAERWDMGALFRYRSRRDLMEISANPDFSERHDYKIAALEKTIAYPLDPWFQLGDPRLVLALVFGVAGLATQLRQTVRARDAAAETAG